MATKKTKRDSKITLLLGLTALETGLFFYLQDSSTLSNRALYSIGAALIATTLLLALYTLPTPKKKRRK